jgi:hypothetical protein
MTMNEWERQQNTSESKAHSPNNGLMRDKRKRVKDGSTHYITKPNNYHHHHHNDKTFFLYINTYQLPVHKRPPTVQQGVFTIAFFHTGNNIL